MKKTIDQINLENKKVLVRVDFNVPIVNGVVTSNKRIEAAIPTIRKIVSSGGRAILLSHLGRVKTKKDLETKSLAPVVEVLVNLIDMPITFIPATSGPELEEAIEKMEPGQILMMENTRFEDLNDKAESHNNPKLAKYWASLGDVFINDAFGTAHRAHASNVGIATFIKESGIGYLMEKEIKNLSKALYGANHPIVAILGGAKVSDKIDVINNLLNFADKLIIGGAMAYTFLAAQGIGIGKSLIETDKINEAREYLKNNLEKFVLPIDYALAKNFEDVKPIYNKENSLEIPDGYMGLDIGPKSVEVFKRYLKNAKTVIWNGPMGVTEFRNYKAGTKGVAEAIINLKGDVFSVVGGGDSVAIIEELGLENRFSHVSTGGGASLEFFEGKHLPGIDAIQDENEDVRENGFVSDSLGQNENSSINEHTKAFSTLSSQEETNKNKEEIKNTSEFATKEEIQQNNEEVVEVKNNETENNNESTEATQPIQIEQIDNTNSTDEKLLTKDQEELFDLKVEDFPTKENELNSTVTTQDLKLNNNDSDVRFFTEDLEIIPTSEINIEDLDTKDKTQETQLKNKK